MRLWIFRKLTKLPSGSFSVMKICGCSQHPRQKRNCVQLPGFVQSDWMYIPLMKISGSTTQKLRRPGKQICSDEDPSLVLEDGATRIFLNTRGTNRSEVSEDLVQFLEYMEQSALNVDIPDSNKNLIKIHNHVRQVKASEEIGVKFMQRWEEEAMLKREGREEGLSEGHKRGLSEGLERGRSQGEIALILTMLKNGLSTEQIASATDKTIEEIQAIANKQ